MRKKEKYLRSGVEYYSNSLQITIKGDYSFLDQTKLV